MPDWVMIDPQLRHLTADGVSPTAMAKRLNLARQTVVDRLRKLGLKDAKPSTPHETLLPNDVGDVSPEPMTSEDANTPADKPVSPIGDIVPVIDVDGPLTPAEVQTLEHYEQIIGQGIKTFVEVGHALLAIRDQRLYRQTHPTFEAYVQERWELSRPSAYRLMDASAVVAHLSVSGDILPANEAQARPLASVPPAQQPQVWREVVKTAPTSGVTAKHVQATVKRLRAATSAGRAQQERPTPDRAKQAAEWHDRLQRHFRELEQVIKRFAAAGGVLVLARDWEVGEQRKFVSDLRGWSKTFHEMATHFEKVIIGEEAALQALAEKDE